MPTFINSVSSHKIAYAWIETHFAALKLRSATAIAWIIVGLTHFFDLLIWVKSQVYMNEMTFRVTRLQCWIAHCIELCIQCPRSLFSALDRSTHSCENSQAWEPVIMGELCLWSQSHFETKILNIRIYYIINFYHCITLLLSHLTANHQSIITGDYATSEQSLTTLIEHSVKTPEVGCAIRNLSAPINVMKSI